MSGFDLSTAGAVIEREDEGQVVHITDQAGVPMMHGEENDKPVTMTVVGTYSQKYRRAMESRTDKRFKLGRKSPDPEALRAEALEVVADCVLAWDGFYSAGKALDCNRKNVVQVLTLAPWIHEQIATAMDDHAGFSRATSSS